MKRDIDCRSQRHCRTIGISAAILLVVLAVACSRSQREQETVDVPLPLRSITDPHVMEIAERLFDQQMEIRIIATRKLAQMGSPQAIEPLIHTLRVDQPPVRVAAAEALMSFPCPRTVEALVDMLSYADRDVGSAIVVSLLSMKDIAEDSLLVAMRSSRSLISLRAAIALAEMGSEKALEPLKEFFAREQGAHRSVAAQSLMRIGDGGRDFLMKEFFTTDEPDKMKQAALALATRPDFSIPVFTTVLSDQAADKDRAIAAVEGIRATAVEDCESVLLPLLKTAEGSLKLTVVLALGDCGDQQALEALAKMEDEESPLLYQMVRFSSEKILSRQKEKK